MSAARILQYSPASIDLLRQGTAVILAAANTVTVADAAITAKSLVVCCGVGAADATLYAYAVDVVSAGVGFTIRGVGTNAAAVAPANKVIGYAVLKY